MPGSAIAWSHRAPVSRWRSRRSGTTPCGRCNNSRKPWAITAGCSTTDKWPSGHRPVSTKNSGRCCPMPLRRRGPRGPGYLHPSQSGPGRQPRISGACAGKSSRHARMVRRELLTPFGLRTLASSDPRSGGAGGGVAARDGAYHQGTVWPWLMGPFISAYVKAHDRSAEARAGNPLAGALSDHMLEAGLGQISEIFDGDPPHTPRGCIAQAWSVAEVLRAAAEDL